MSDRLADGDYRAKRRERWLKDQPERSADVLTLGFRFSLLTAIEKKAGREIDLVAYPHTNHVITEGIEVPYFDEL